jgi:hypothetical protein
MGHPSQGNHTNISAPHETSAQKAARKLAAQEDFARTEAGIASANAGRESAGYARAQGISPAQAALLAGGTAGSTYGTAYGSNLASKMGLDVQTYGIDKGYQQAQNQLNQQNQNNVWNALGTGASAAALIFSDKNVKTDIKDGWGILEHVTRSVSPKSFNYKGDDTQRQGILAQDLEKTPLKSTVIDTPQGKMVDTNQLTTANTGMISELSRKVDNLAKFMKSGGKIA